MEGIALNPKRKSMPYSCVVDDGEYTFTRYDGWKMFKWKYIDIIFDLIKYYKREYDLWREGKFKKINGQWRHYPDHNRNGANT